MANNIGRLNVGDLISQRGYSRESEFNKFIKGQANRATEELAALIDQFKKKGRKVSTKGVFGKVPWLKNIISMGGNIAFPGGGSLISGLVDMIDTANKNKNYHDMIQDLKADIEIPDFIKGTFMEDYFTTGSSAAQKSAIEQQTGTQKASLLSGGLGALLSFISAGKGFARGKEMKDALAATVPSEMPPTGRGISYPGDIGNVADYDVITGEPIPGGAADPAILNQKLEELSQFPNAMPEQLIQGHTNKLGAGAVKLLDKSFGNLPMVEFLTNPLINLGRDNMLKTAVTEATTPAGYASLLETPLLRMLMGADVEASVPRLQAPRYRTRRQ